MRVRDDVAADDDAVRRAPVGLPEAAELSERPDVRSGQQRSDVGLRFLRRQRTLEDNPSVAVVSGRWRWDAEPWSASGWAVFIVAAIVLGIAVKVQALATRRWIYTPNMPVSPALGVGFVPVAQLLILTSASVKLAARFVPGPRAVSAYR